MRTTDRRRSPSWIAHHEAATAALVDTAGQALLVHHLTLAECLVGAIRTGRLDDVLGALDRLGVVVAGVDDGSALRLARLRAATDLRMPDCCALDVADRHGAALLTFDERQRGAARHLGLATITTG